MKRIKITQPVINSRAQAESLAGEIAELTIKIRDINNTIDAAVKAARAEWDDTLAALEKSVNEKSTTLQAWAESNPSEFGNAKSLDMHHAVVGWRTGMYQAKPLSGWTWDRVLEKIEAAKEVLARFVRIKKEVDKQGLITERDGLGPETLRTIGVRVFQEESFYIDLKLTEQSDKIQTAA